MADQAETTEKDHYGLFTITGKPGIRLALQDEGITIEADRLYWRDGEIEKTASLQNLREVRLQVGQTKDGTIGTCCLTFSNHATLTITSASKLGFPDEARSLVYADFLRDLHAVLAAQKGSRIRFAAGFTEGRHKFAVGAMILGAAFFVALPIGLFLFTGEAEALWITGTGVLFIYPLFRSMQRNAPQSYSPTAIPEELLP